MSNDKPSNQRSFQQSKGRLRFGSEYKRPVKEEEIVEEVVEDVGFETKIEIRQDNYPLLYNYATLMNKKEVTVLNRERELRAMYGNLNRRMMPNVALLGPAGTGKSALVESYATLHRDDGVLIFEVNLVLMMDKGDEVFGERMKRLITEVENLVNERAELGEIHLRSGRPLDVILFFDEMHLLTQAAVDRGAIGSIASNAIKPALARGSIKVIGATTDREYDMYIKLDDAFHTRFQALRLNEPDNDTVVDILRNLLEYYTKKDKFPYVEMTDDEVLAEIVEYANRYIQASAQPRKSISILDGALGYANAFNERIDHSMIKRIFEEKYRVDVDWKSDIDAVLDTIRDGLIGQDLAIQMLSNRLFVANVGLQDKGRPLANFLFAGSTGVGKAIWDDTPVPVFENNTLSYKRHGDLEIGDYVFNRLGQPVKVKAVYPQGELNAFMVYVAGENVVCNDEHLWRYRLDDSSDWLVAKLSELLQLQADGHKVYIPRSSSLRYGKDLQINMEVLARAFCETDVPALDSDLNYLMRRLIYDASYENRAEFVKLVMERFGKVYGDRRSCVIEYRDFNVWRLLHFQRLLLTLGISVREGERRQSLRIVSIPDDLQSIFVEDISVLGNHFKVCDVELLYAEDLEMKLPMKCIEVDDEESLYLVTESHIVTHNTEMSKLISEGIFGSKEAMIRFDMSEFNREEDANIFQLRLADAVERKPYSLVLLDEFEKASRPVKNLMLGVMDDGRLTDRYGRQVAFNNCIIVITTNAGHDAFKQIKEMNLNVEEMDSYLRNELKKEFPAEFLGRFDEVVPFAPLTASGFEEIAKIQVSRLMAKVATDFDIELQFDNRVPIYLVYQRFDAERDTSSGGGRAMKRRIEREVAPLVARVIEKCRLLNRARPVMIRIVVIGDLVYEHKDLVKSDAYLAAEFTLADLTQGYLSEYDTMPQFTEFLMDEDGDVG